MSSKEITITAADGGEFMGHLATPTSGGGPGVVVIQEIFGVNAVMRGITDGLAGEGFVALCPDLFWRQEPGIQITDQTDEEWARSFKNPWLGGVFPLGRKVTIRGNGAQPDPTVPQYPM